ncbi:delta-60 repeat domain-containing protein [Meiothermus hypogaeus]|uniref:Delta-60 repeat domain-containing protein n=2 Tax=Meiothermus hypogaeus TaxID=884155 RepID=A0A511QXE9_9DEIN|nr:delta-60 repeat domain-containing protein [Meiothermus hypogaeus]RIH80657.1 delta-60 repeat domain protein [Meiothermus hypogaeus]GEM82054.1 hypothetical protein MHY01S_02200 [Meiothermus hypogaeus NBRC 106114]
MGMRFGLYSLLALVLLACNGGSGNPNGSNPGGGTPGPQLSFKGELDTSFGNGGIVTTPVTSANAKIWITSLIVQPDRKIVVAGYIEKVVSPSYVDDIILLRYNPDGTLDTTFGNEGTVVTSLSDYSDRAHALVLQPDGKLVVAGSTANSNYYEIALVRYNEYGKLDTSFDGDGIVVASPGPYSDEAYALLLLPGGKLLVGGYSDKGAPNYETPVLLRYNSDGSQDASFGIKQIASLTNSRAKHMLLQPDGKILLGIGARFGTSFGFALSRLLDNGTVDTSFGGQGMVSGNGLLRYLMRQSDGRLIASVGDRLKRYEANGNPDIGFGTGGNVDQYNQYTILMAQQSDGKLISLASHSSPKFFALYRHNLNGTVDPSFGSNGYIETQVSTNYDAVASAMTFQPDNRLIVAGSANTNVILVRYK